MLTFIRKVAPPTIAAESATMKNPKTTDEPADSSPVEKLNKSALMENLRLEKQLLRMRESLEEQVLQKLDIEKKLYLAEEKLKQHNLL
jgi:hypothetical protein